MNHLETIPVPEPICYRILTWVIEHGNGACVLLQIEPKHPSCLMYEKDNPFSNIKSYGFEHGLYVFECEEQANGFNILRGQPMHIHHTGYPELIREKRSLLRGRQEVAEALGLEDGALFADIVREINYREN